MQNCNTSAIVRWLAFFTFLRSIVELSFLFFVGRCSLFGARVSLFLFLVDWVFFFHFLFYFDVCRSSFVFKFRAFGILVHCDFDLWLSSVWHNMWLKCREMKQQTACLEKTLENILDWMGTKIEPIDDVIVKFLLQHKRYDNWKLGRVPNMKRAAHRTI